MSYIVYIVVENGEAYPNAYIKYESAVAAVKEKHKTYIEEQIKELACLEDIESVLKDINVPENTTTGISQLYIEKGINITIQKTPIV
jgi:hypothetical protein